MGHTADLPAPDRGDLATTPSNVIDFDRPARTERTTVRVERREDRFAQLSDDARRRLLVRILCELVALEDPEPKLQARAS